MWPFNRRAASAVEKRETIQVSAPYGDFMSFFGVSASKNLPNVTIDSALTVPAVMAAVTFLSRTLAALPLHAYRGTKAGPQKISGKLEIVVHDAPNDSQDSFKFRQYFWQQVFTGGRGLAYIERTPQGVESLWLLDPTRTTIKRAGGRVTYEYAGDGGGRGLIYQAADVIDVPFMLKPDGLSHYGPVALASKAIQLALAMNEYGSNFFSGGGIPPLALVGPLPQGAEAMKRANEQIARSIDEARKNEKPIIPIPAGHDLKPVGFDPAKGQMVDARRFQIEEIARVYQIPPVFLQDLSKATFSNAEQQDLHLVKHLIAQWAEALEGEMNLKLFGRDKNNRYVEHNLDGLLRGDFASRMTGYAQAIQNAIRTPDEIRLMENLPAKGGDADKLLIQGATVPLGQQPAQGAAETIPANDNNNNDEADAA